jgi:ComF family protein
VRETHLKSLLDRYKFDSAKEAGMVCAELLDERLPLLPQELTVTAVPTSPAHVRVRGFDHMATVASRFADKRGLRYRKVLKRSTNETQHFKARGERLTQAAAGLEVIANPPDSILLIDDIYTTGATLRACTRKLQEAGVQEIFVAIIARQTLDVGDDL